jgi:peptide chain release factor 1
MLSDEKDDEMRDMLKEEIKEQEVLIPEMEETLKIELLPKDPNDDKNIMVEVRA